jgi:hypothetical protein
VTAAVSLESSIFLLPPAQRLLLLLLLSWHNTFSDAFNCFALLCCSCSLCYAIAAASSLRTSSGFGETDFITEP